MDDTTIYTGIPHQKTTGTDLQPGLSSNPKTHTYLSTQQLTGVTGMTQTSPVRSTRIDGTQTTPPNHPGKTTTSGGTQTSPPRPSENNRHDQSTQGLLDCNQEAETDAQPQGGKGKGSKGKKGRKSHLNPLTPVLAHLPTLTQGKMSHPGTLVLADLPSSVQHVANTITGAGCVYDNFSTTCNDHSHATHMCRAPKDSL